MTVKHRLLVMIACALAIPSVPARAAAQTNDTALAAQLFTDARTLMRKGDYAEASKRLTESARLDPRVGTFANLAECDEKLGHPAAARGNWQQALNLAQSTHDDRIHAVQEQFERLDRIVPKLQLSAAAPLAETFLVSIDNVSLGPGAIGTLLPIDPGVHSIAASAPGKKTWTTTLQAGSNGAVAAILIPALEDDPSAARIAIAPSSSHERQEPDVAPAPPGPARTVGLAVLGAGAAGVGVGTVFGVLAMSEKSSARSACGPSYPVCDPQTSASVEGHQATGRTDATISTIAFALGGAALVGGTILYLVARPKTPHAESRWVLSPAVARDAGAIVVHGAW
jgi:hypothetical protein